MTEMMPYGWNAGTSCASEPKSTRAQDNGNSTRQSELARRLERLSGDIATRTGAAPIPRNVAAWLLEEVAKATTGAIETVFAILAIHQTLAVQTAALKANGAQRAIGAEAGALHREAAELRACFRSIPVLAGDIVKFSQEVA